MVKYGGKSVELIGYAENRAYLINHGNETHILQNVTKFLQDFPD